MISNATISKLVILGVLASPLPAVSLSMAGATVLPGASGQASVSFQAQGAQVTAVQFDLQYDGSALTITSVAGAAATAAGKSVMVNGKTVIIYGGTSALGDGAVVSLNIAAASSAPAGSYPVVFSALIASDAKGDAVLLTISNGSVTVGSGGSGPKVASGGILNAASLATGPVAPGSIVSIFGSGMAGGTGQSDTVPVSTTVAGARLTLNGVAMPLFYVSPGQINAQVPYETATGTANLVVAASGVSGAPVPLSVAPAAPGIFQLGNNRAAMQNADYSINSDNNPAKVGSAVTIYLTGQGPLDHTIATGAVASPDANPLYSATLPTTVTIGTTAAKVAFAGLTPGMVGLMQVNAVVPDMPPGAYPLVVTIGGARSNSALVSVMR
jgi:uncharacterized protein (TIGR03437 family)